jgi:hypothetical protein
MGEVAFRHLQGGLEATKGTAVAATRILMARVTNANFNQPREFVEEDRGTLVGATRFNAGVKDYTFAIEADGASYEQLGWFLETCLKGSVSATTVNTTGKQYVFSPNTTTAGDDLQAATFEFGDDTQSYRAAYCEGTSWTLAFDTLTVGQAAPLKLTVNYLTKSLASNTKTAALTSPTVESILGTSAHFYLGSASTAFGSLAEVTGSLRSFSLTSDNKLGRKVFVGDGDTYTNIGRGRRMDDLRGDLRGRQQRRHPLRRMGPRDRQADAAPVRRQHDRELRARDRQAAPHRRPDLLHRVRPDRRGRHERCLQDLGPLHRGLEPRHSELGHRRHAPKCGVELHLILEALNAGPHVHGPLLHRRR